MSIFDNIASGKGLGSFGSAMSDSKWKAALGAAGSLAGNVGGSLIGGGMESTAGGIIGGLSNVASAIPGPWGAIAGAGLGVVGGLVNRMFGSKLNQENINAVEGTIGNLNSFQSNAGDYDALTQNILNQPATMHFDKDFIGKDGWFSSKAKKKFRELQDRQKEAAQFVSNSLTNNLGNISSTQAQNLEANFAALGGPIFMTGDGILSPFGNRFSSGGTLSGPLHSNGADWTNGLIFVNNGSSHESNPNEGVQMGVDSQGIPNLVEEGEVVWNNYVFSNRMKVPKAVREKYKLRGTKDLTFADAVKKSQKESEERPNDPISQRGLDDILTKLAIAQEAQREKMNNRRRNNMYSEGGGISISPSKKGTFTAAASKHGKSVQEFASQVLANPDNYSSAMVKKANFARNAAKWHHAYGGVMGNLFDGTGLYPNMFSDINSWALTPDKNAANLNETPAWDTYFRNNIGVTNNRSLYTPGMSAQDLSNAWSRRYRYENRGINPSALTVKNLGLITPSKNIKLHNNYPLLGENAAASTNITSDDTSGSWMSGLRYVPALGAGINVFTDLMGWTNRPDYSRADAILEASKGIRDVRFNPIGDYMRYNPLDRMLYINQANANSGSSRRNILNTAAGNRGNAMAGILASDYNTLDQLGKLARQAEEYNFAQRAKVAEFNRDTNKFNSEGFLRAQQTNQSAAEIRLRAAQTAAQLRDAIDARVGAARSANFTNLFDSIGDIGREEFSRNMINSNRAQYYTIGRDGVIHYKPSFYNQSLENQKELRKQAEQDSKDIKSKKEAYGGFITVNRRR